jgi:hypothetical protein
MWYGLNWFITVANCRLQYLVWVVEKIWFYHQSQVLIWITLYEQLNFCVTCTMSQDSLTLYVFLKAVQWMPLHVMISSAAASLAEVFPAPSLRMSMCSVQENEYNTWKCTHQLETCCKCQNDYILWKLSFLMLSSFYNFKNI